MQYIHIHNYNICTCTYIHTKKCKLLLSGHTHLAEPGCLCIIKQVLWANARASNSQEDWPSLSDNVVGTRSLTWTKKDGQVICTPDNSRSPFAAEWTGGMVSDTWISHTKLNGGGKRGWWLHQINWGILGTWTHYLAIMSPMSYPLHHIDTHTHLHTHIHLSLSIFGVNGSLVVLHRSVLVAFLCCMFKS